MSLPGRAAAEEVLVGFSILLRAAGMAITPDRTSSFLEAVSLAGFDDRAATYWSGRATLCSSLEDNELYDRAFTAWFAASPEEARLTAPPMAPRQPQASLSTESNSSDSAGDALLAARASATEVLRHRDLALLTDQERTELAMLFDRLDVVPPLRRALRRRPHHRGSVDLRRTLRAQLRAAGELVPLRRRRPGMRGRRIVMLIDVSGSMQPYADSLLRLAHRIVRAVPHRVEVFTIGTRLTRITPALRARQAAEAFCVWLSAKTGKTYRLPTEAEWARAAELAAGKDSTSASREAITWHRGNANATTHPVAARTPDALGLFDLFGNAAEWVTTTDNSRVTRGGSFRDARENTGPAARAQQDPSWNERDPQLPKSRWWLSDGPFVGFRVVTGGK